MESFEGGETSEGEAVGLVKEGLSFCVTGILVGYLETYGLSGFLLTIGGMSAKG